MLYIFCGLLFVYWSVYDGKKGDKRHEKAIRDLNLHEILTRAKAFYKDALYSQLSSGVNHPVMLVFCQLLIDRKKRKSPAPARP